MMNVSASRTVGARRRWAGLALLLGSASWLAAVAPTAAEAATLLDACTGAGVSLPPAAGLVTTVAQGGLGTVDPATGTLGSTPSTACNTALNGVVATTGTQGGTGTLGLTGTQGATGDLTATLGQVASLANAADDATVDVGQLRGLSAQLGNTAAASLGGGSVYNPLLGTVSLPTFQIRGTTYASVGAALDAVDLALRTDTGNNGSNIDNQTYATNVQVNNVQHGAVQYDRATDGSTLSSVTLASDAGGPVVIHNLAPGVGANDAATVGQVQAVANNAVQYTTVNGVKSNTVMLSGGSPGGVTIGNLAPGVAGTDAVNVNQLRASSAGALTEANAYTDGQIGNLRAFTDKAIASARRDASGGTALALAATGIRFDDRPGKFSVGGATSYYDGQLGLALGVAGTSETGRVRVNAAISASPTMDHPNVGGVVGASVAIN